MSGPLDRSGGDGGRPTPWGPVREDSLKVIRRRTVCGDSDGLEDEEGDTRYRTPVPEGTRVSLPFDLGPEGGTPETSVYTGPREVRPDPRLTADGEVWETPLSVTSRTEVFEGDPKTLKGGK